VPRARNFFSVMHLQKSASFCEIVFLLFYSRCFTEFSKENFRHIGPWGSG